MLSVDIFSRVPIYQQVIDGIKNNIRLGLYRQGDQIPSIRELSVELGVNPNTVSKSYAELERSGVISAAIGKGYYVTPDALERINSVTVTTERQALTGAAEKLASAGVPEEELVQLIHQVYQRHTKKENET